MSFCLFILVKDLEDCHGKFYDAKTQLCCPDTTELKISYIVFDIKDVGNLCPIIRSKTGRQECEHLKSKLMFSSYQEPYMFVY